MLATDPRSDSPKLSGDEFKALRTIMKAASGIELPDEKQYLVIHRLGKRLRFHGLDTFTDYLSLVRQDADERQMLIDLLTTNETWFFREQKHFDRLASFCRQHRGMIRVWSAASSTGEEAYSIAMILAENAPGRQWEVVGTDISHSVVERATEGLFPVKAVDTIPREYLKKYWLKGVGSYSGNVLAKAALRDNVHFRVGNLNERLPSSIGMFEVAFLRNVLIYFSTEGKLRLLRNVLERVKKDGLLMVGHSESLHGFDLPLEQLAPSIYRKIQ